MRRKHESQSSARRPHESSTHSQALHQQSPSPVSVQALHSTFHPVLAGNERCIGCRALSRCELTQDEGHKLNSDTMRSADMTILQTAHSKTPRRQSPAMQSAIINEPQAMRTGTWARDEHERYVQALQELRGHSWKAIAAFIGTRTVRQVLSHHQKFLGRRQQQAQAQSLDPLGDLDDVEFQGILLSEAEETALDRLIQEWDDEELQITLAMLKQRVEDDDSFEEQVDQVLKSQGDDELRTIFGL